jgi:hypothetical protein
MPDETTDAYHIYLQNVQESLTARGADTSMDQHEQRTIYWAFSVQHGYDVAASLILEMRSSGGRLSGTIDAKAINAKWQGRAV